MTALFGIPIDQLTTYLLITTGIIVVGVSLLALGNAIFFRIGVRNIPRRRMQMVLIVFALMLSTTLLSSVLATGDVLTATVQTVAVFNWGNVDELIEGGRGDLGTYSTRIYNRIRHHAEQDSDIIAVGAALREQNLLLADQTSRQVRSQVTALAIVPGSEQGFGGMIDQKIKKRVTIADLKPNQVYLNLTTASLLNAHAGDTLYVYSQRWPGKRYTMQVAAIVGDDGLVGDNPFILSQLSTFDKIEGMNNEISQIFVANRGGGGANGVGGVALTDSVTATLNQLIPTQFVHVIQVKAQGVQTSQKAEDIFSRVFDLFTLFALAIGLLLIFLIFVLLAAERRAEMGMARAIGVQRHQLILMYLFEGSIYDLVASFVGLLVGVGAGALLMNLLDPILARFKFPLKPTFQPRSLIIAYCLGVIFTFASVVLSSWLVSRMNVVEALRDLPEPGRSASSLGDLGVRIVHIAKMLFSPSIIRKPRDIIQKPIAEADVSHPSPKPMVGADLSRPSLIDQLAASPDKSGVGAINRPLPKMRRQINWRRVRRALFEMIPDGVVELVRVLTALGFVPLLAGLWLMQLGLEQAQIVPFSLGFSLIVVGGGLLLKALVDRCIWFALWLKIYVAHSSSHGELSSVKGSGDPDAVYLEMSMRRVRRVTNALFATLMGVVVLAYWALPFDVLAQLGLPRFQGGIEVFFVAGSMMVLAAVWVLMTNAGLVLRPLLALCSALHPSIHALARLATAYPLQRRFRTGLSVIMFSLVVFAMTMMAIVTNAMQNTYTNIDTQTGGYDIQATPYFKPLPDLHTALEQHGISPSAFSAIGVRDTTAVGVIQLSAQQPRWFVYPAQVIDGGFLQGYGLHLTARASGFNSDSAVWQALQTHANYALIDSSALPYNPNGILNGPVYDPSVPKAADAGAPATPPGFDQRFTFALSGVYQGDTSFQPRSVWVVGSQGGPAMKLTIIGVVDNSDSAHFGLYIPRSAYSGGGDPGVEKIGPAATAVDVPTTQSYYFKVAPGQDKRTLALALGSAFLDYGLETTVLEDEVWQVRGPRILLSNVLLGVVGMTLLLGVAALAITGTRAVIERRQQIGMLRALGCRRHMIQSAFLLESFLVGTLGSILGVTLGVILARNIFAANFFEQYQTGLFFGIPWQQLALIVGAALLAAFLGAILPAWQAGRITPAEALRYS